MKLRISSFGRKHGPITADLILDVRCLENPFWVPELKALTGLDLPVQEYILAHSGDYMDKLLALLKLHLSLAGERGFEELHIAFGCTGGRHRSVCTAELMAKALADLGYSVELCHRDLKLS